MLRVFIISFLFLFVSVGSASADFCSFCKTSGCLIDYQTAKSDRCRSCQICLRDEAPDKTDTENGDNDEQHGQGGISIIDNSSIIFGHAEHQTSGDKIKDCSDDNWKQDATCEDLKFQKRMAKSAEDIIGLTWWQIGLSVIGLGGILWSLKEAREANRIAREANLTTNIALSRDRAWFLPDSFDDIPIVNGNGDELGTNIFCKFKNSGNSPATQVNIINTIRFGANVGDCLAQIDSLMVNEDRYTSAVIGPNETCLTTSQELPANIIEMIMQGRTTAVYAVLATYRDIFNPETERRSESYQKVSFTRRRNDAGVSSLLPIFESIPERAEIVT